MTATEKLHLYEEILLLALDDTRGTVGFGSWEKVEMGGAILAELVMMGAVTIADDKKKHVRKVAGRPRPADPILAEALAKVSESRKLRKAGDWVQKFSGIKDLKNRTARQLVKKGVLREKTGTVLGIFHRTVFPETNPGPEQDLRRRMEKAIFTATTNVDPGTVVIIALTRATGRLEKIFPRKRLKPRKERLEKLVNGEVIGTVTREVVDAIRAAIVVAAIVPVVIASSTAGT